MNRRMMKAVVNMYSSSFCASPASIAKPNDSLLPSMMPNTNTAMKPLACRPSAREIAPITATNVTTRRVFGKERPFLMGDEEAARYPSAMPATMAMTDCLSRSINEDVSENFAACPSPPPARRR